MIAVIVILMLSLAAGGAVAQEAPAQVSPSNATQPAAPGDQPPPLTVENIDKQTEVIRNPGLAVDKAKQVLGNAGQPAATPSPPSVAVSLEPSEKRLSDPTQMTGSFTQALGRVKGSAAGGAPAAPSIPNVTLAAKAICNHNSKRALLNVAGKTRMVSEGSQFSFIENGVLHEILVKSIEKDHVHISLLPSGREMLLE